MRDKNWMKFEASGRVDDYLTYCRYNQDPQRIFGDKRNDRNEDEDESECDPDGDGFDFDARW